MKKFLEILGVTTALVAVPSLIVRLISGLMVVNEVLGIIAGIVIFIILVASTAYVLSD